MVYFKNDREKNKKKGGLGGSPPQNKKRRTKSGGMGATAAIKETPTISHFLKRENMQIFMLIFLPRHWLDAKCLVYIGVPNLWFRGYETSGFLGYTSSGWLWVFLGRDSRYNDSHTANNALRQRLPGSRLGTTVKHDSLRRGTKEVQ